MVAEMGLAKTATTGGLQMNGVDGVYRKILAILGRNLDRRIIGDPDFSARIPAFSHFVIQIAVPHDTTLSIKTAIEEFNQWSRKISTANVEEEHPICYVTCHLRLHWSIGAI